MHVLATTGDASGIGDLTFFGLCAAIGAIAVVATAIRRSLTRSHAPGPALHLDKPDDIAYLHDGPGLTVLSALSAMHVAGRIVSAGGRRVRAVGVADPAAGELERAIHSSAQHPVRLADLPRAPLVAEALGRIERRLIDADLLWTASRLRRVGRRVGVVAALGVFLIAGFIGLGLLAMLAFAALYVAMRSGTGPRRTDRGDAELTRLRTAHATLSPRLRPNWRVYGPSGAALGVAVFGASALWAADPAWAKEIGAGHTVSVGVSGEGGCGGCGGCGG